MTVIPFKKPDMPLLWRSLGVLSERAGAWVEVAVHATVVADYGKRQGNFRPSIAEELRANVDKLDADLRHFETLQASIDPEWHEIGARLKPIGRSLSRSRVLMLESLAIFDSSQNPK